MTSMAASKLESLEAAAQFVRSHGKFAVISHVNPDADAIGSTLGLTLGLTALGFDALPVLSDRIPDYARFLAGVDRFAPTVRAPVDALIYVDAADRDRVGGVFGEEQDQLLQLPTLNVDHHRTNPGYATLNYVDAQASSSSELVFRLLSKLGTPIRAETANALLFGIVGDTGSFRNGATTPSSLEVASHLLDLGGDVQRIAFQLFEAKTFAAARLLGMILGTLELDPQRKIVVALMSQAMLRESGATADEAEGTAEYLRGVEEAETVILLKETPEGEMRVSFRSRPAVDVAAVATALGGGGHRQAAGATVAGPAEKAKETILKAYDAVLKGS